MDGRFKFILMAVLLAITISISMNFRGLFSNIEDLRWQVSKLNEKLETLSNDYNNLEQNIRNELALQGSILSSYKVTYGTPDVASLIGDITIAVTPKERSESTQATISLGDKTVPMNLNGNSYEAVIPAPVDRVYSKLTVSFKEGDTIRSEVLEPGEIGFMNLINHNIYSSFLGEIAPKENNEYSMSGRIELYVSDLLGEPSTIKLVALKNNTDAIWEADSLFISQGNGAFVVDINKSFTLNRGDDIGLYLEIKDAYGFIHRSHIEGTYYAIGDAVTGASATPETRIYDNSGRVIEFKYYEP